MYSVSQAQTAGYKFNRLTIYNGLSQNMVHCLTQDYLGYMWFGTKDGLNRYDGYTFKIYKSDLFDPASICDNQINYLYEDDKHNLWIGTRKGLSLYDRENDRFINFDREKITKNSLVVNCISGNSKDGLWISSFGGEIIGLDIVYTPGKRTPEVKVKRIITKAEIRNDRAENILLEKNVGLWIFGIKGISHLDLQSGTIDTTGFQYQTYLFQPELSKSRISANKYSPFHSSMQEGIQDENGHLWFIGKEGLYKFDKKNRQFILYKLNEWAKTLISKVNNNGDTEIWIGLFYQGLNIINTRTGHIDKVTTESLGEEKGTDMWITKFCKGRDGTVWLGTSGWGIIYSSPINSMFKKETPHDFYPPANISNSVYLLYPLKNSQGKSVIISTLRYFLHKSASGKVFYSERFYARDPVEDEEGNVWLCSTLGLIKYDPVKQQVSYIDTLTKAVSGLYIERGYAWYTTPYMLKRYDMRTEKIHDFPISSEIIGLGLRQNETAHTVIQDAGDDKLWIGTVNGLLLFDIKKGRFAKVYKNDANDKNSINSNEIKCILPDPFAPDSILWVGTPAGLNKFYKQQNIFKHYGIEDGLPNNTIYGILPDNNGNLWISTNQGLSVFNIKGEYFTNFDVNNGLQSNEFNTGAYYESEDGELFFGGIEGFNRFYPKNIKLPTRNIPIVLTDVQLLGSKAPHQFFTIRDNILGHNDNNISITLSSLDYFSPNKIRYAYRIVNKDSTWFMLGNNRTVALSNLSPGKYVFQAKGTDAFGRWGNDVATMTFIIRKPWWNSAVAQAIYFLISGLIAFYLWRNSKKRMQRKNEIENERRQAAAVLELDKAKTRFLTNITHEFRTPLTMILGMTDPTGGSKTDNSEDSVKKDKIIHRNGQQLLQLVDQLLELSRLESGKQTVNNQAGNLAAYLNHAVYSFESLAQSKNIQLEFKNNLDERSYLFDFVKLQQIVSNLISNAVKFSREHGHISVVASMRKKDQTSWLDVEVQDTGIGIPEDEIANIFDRFHRVRSSETGQIPGTGIGLALAKELVVLMNGDIEVKSQFGAGSTFRFAIPLVEAVGVSGATSIAGLNNRVIPAENEIPVDTGESDKAETLAEQNVNDKPELLIVEDNADVRNYIHSLVSEKYRVITAVNGKDGLDKAMEYMPDIIISDVMMPEMDGFTLCDKIKSDPLTNHIPVILLTAKVDSESRITGLRKGADYYLAKPFSHEELLIRLENISRLIHRMREKYVSLMDGISGDKVVQPKMETPSGIQDSMPGEEFLLQVMAILEDHYTNEEYSIEDLAGQLFMSRSQLFRKVKVLTGNSPSTFVRSFRLHKAKALLEARPDLTISEVAYSVGFNSPKYFSNVYLDEFGVRPKKE